MTAATIKNKKPNQGIREAKGIRKRLKKTKSIIDSLAAPEADYIDFKPPKLNKKMYHPENF